MSPYFRLDADKEETLRLTKSRREYFTTTSRTIFSRLFSTGIVPPVHRVYFSWFEWTCYHVAIPDAHVKYI